MIVMTAFKSNQFLTIWFKILKIGEKCWSYGVHVKMSAEKWRASCIPFLDTNVYMYQFFNFFVGNEGNWIKNIPVYQTLKHVSNEKYCSLHGFER
jgi:hypothetical protein